MDCLPCLFSRSNRRKYKRMDMPMPTRKRTLDETIPDIYYFGPMHQYAGEKHLINEYLYWIEYNKKRLVFGQGHVKAVRAMSDISEAMIQQSVLYYNISPACGLGHLSLDYDNLEPYPYNIEGIYGPVIDFDCMRDSGYATTSLDILSQRFSTKGEIEEFRKKETEWNLSHLAMSRFHEIMCQLAARLLDLNRLQVFLNGDVYVSKGLFEFADSMAHFAMEYCRYGTHAQNIPVRMIPFDMWRFIKWDIKPSYFEKKMDSPRRNVVFVT